MLAHPFVAGRRSLEPPIIAVHWPVLLLCVGSIVMAYVSNIGVSTYAFTASGGSLAIESTATGASSIE